jgi:hypothetical protein
VGKRDVDRRSDIFSLGCLVFEMLAGHPPFVGEPGDVLAHQLHSLPPDVSLLVPELPRAAGVLLRRAMAKIPLDRPTSAGDFAQSLRDVFGLAADGTLSRVLAPPLIMPRRNSAREVPRAEDVATRQAEMTPDMPREAATVPVEALAAHEAVTGGTPTPPFARGETLSGEGTVVTFSSVTPLSSREGPTGPTARQRAAQLRAAGIGLGGLALAVAVVIALAWFVAAPPLAGPTPVPRPVGELVVEVNPPTAATVDMNSTLAPEPPKVSSVISIAPGQETYKPFAYSRFKELRPRHVEVKGGRSGNGAPELEIKVFAPASEGRKELKADVVLDDQRKGLTPIKLKPRVGEHVLQVLCRPYPMTEMVLTSLPGAKQVVEIELLPPGAETWAPEAAVQPHGR